MRLYQASWHPPFSSVSRMSDPIVADPTASSRILTGTPSRALAASASAKRRPISPGQRSEESRGGEVSSSDAGGCGPDRGDPDRVERDFDRDSLASLGRQRVGEAASDLAGP